MEERSLRVLEFHLFLQDLRAFASSEVGQAACLALRPSPRMEEVEIRLREVGEAFNLLKTEGDLPLVGLQEVRPHLQRARAEGTVLSPESLLQIKSTAAAAARARAYLRKAGAPHPLLAEWGEKLPDLQGLSEALRAAIGPRGEILDSASPDLRRLRREIFLLRARIRRALEGLWEKDGLRGIFQEEIITVRNERYVVAVKAEFKNALPGIIHDHSQSRATFFIEPLATLEENNDLNMLLQDEKEEERRILLALTDRIRAEAVEISRAVEILGRLDLLFAEAKWAQAQGATIPALNDRGRWHLREARHPLLGPQAVPIDLRLDPEQSTLIITGANTGGKTAALKTLGLLTLMAQSGIPIPAAEGSEAAVFGKIFADIGDEQSLKENLSTFSAWVRTVSWIVREADSSSLVLLDEAGGGTDPVEGAALTMALLDGLRGRGVKTVVTTHLHLLKAYGAIHSDVVNVSVEFNPDTLRPTFRLIYGRPGESHALLTAEKWGFPGDLVRKAQGYLGEGERKVGELLQRLEKTQQAMEEKLKEAEESKREAESLRRQAESFLDRAREQEGQILHRTREEAREVIREARENLRRLINEFKARGRTDLHRLDREIASEEEKLARFGRKINGETPAAGEPSPSPLLPGSAPDSLAQLKEALARRAGKKSGRGVKEGRIDYQIPPAKREINVIGLRVEEALPLVDKAIDEAFLGGLKELEIIHGSGTGRLRQAIREHLRYHGSVKSFLAGGPGRGGNGATVVEVGPPPSDRPSPRRAPKTGDPRG